MILLYRISKILALVSARTFSRDQWRRSLLVTVAIGFTCLLWATATVAVALAQDDPQAASSGLILVGISADLSEPEVQRLFADQGLEVVRIWPDFQLAALRPIGSAARMTASEQASALASTMATVQALPDVRFVEADHRIEAAIAQSRPLSQTSLFTPTDELYPQQWALELIGMPTAWTITRGDPSIVVAVIDSGVELDHEDLPEEIFWTNLAELNGLPGVDDDGNGYIDDLWGWDWVEKNNRPDDRFGHGTHVAGTLVAAMDNGLGVAGMAPGLRIMPLRVLDERGGGYVSDLVDALDYARRHGARIVNLSLVLRIDSAALHAAIQRVHAEGILVVAATGNYGDRVFWPAAYPEALAVAAVDANDRRAIFSNAGPETDLAAPGVQILSTYKNNSYYKNDGTSMAVPHVAALSGLLWSLRPDLSRDAVVELMRVTAVDANADQYPGPDDFLGVGRIDAATALQKASEGVHLDIQLPVGSYLQGGQRFKIPVRMTVAGANGQKGPVRGGIVYYEVRSPSRDMWPNSNVNPFDSQQWLISDESGYVTLDLILPDEPGPHTLVVRIGLREASVVLNIQNDPLYLSISPARPSIEVADGRTAIEVQARNKSGDLFQDDLRVTLHTSLGHFVDGQQTRTLLMSNGLLTETLYAGERAGSAEVVLEGAGQVQHATVEITAGPPHRVEGPRRLYGLGTGDGAVIELTLTIYDRYGNQVQDEILVNFYSLGAIISPESPLTLNGEVKTQVILGSWIREPVAIWALIPGTFVLYQAEAYHLPYHYHFPIIMNAPTAISD
jgi:subtilisin family serine protease